MRTRIAGRPQAASKPPSSFLRFSRPFETFPVETGTVDFDPWLERSERFGHHLGSFGAKANEPNRTGMPDSLKAGLEGLSGVDLSDVRVHYGSSKPAQLKAFSYAQGTDIHLAPGRERDLPHEGWHLVQQRQGRVQPTSRIEGLPLNEDASLEREADVMGQKAASGPVSSPGGEALQAQPPSPAARSGAGTVQRNPKKKVLNFLLNMGVGWVGNNYSKQQDIKKNPQKYLQGKNEEKGRLRAVYETGKGEQGTAAHAMHLPVSIFHGLFGNIGSSNIGEHYAKDIPHLLEGPDDDKSLENVGKTETEEFWDKQSGLPWLMGKGLSAEGRGNTLKKSRDLQKWLKIKGII